MLKMALNPFCWDAENIWKMILPDTPSTPYHTENSMPFFINFLKASLVDVEESCTLADSMNDDTNMI